MRLILALGALVTIVGCQTGTPATSSHWQQTDDTSLVVDSHALGVALHSAREKIVDGRFNVQDVQWRGDSGWPRIRLVMHDLSESRVTFASNNPFDTPLAKRIKKAFGQFTLDLGEQRKFDNDLGPARAQRFLVNDKNHCIFVGQFTAPSNDLTGSDSELGQIYIEGSMCSAPGNGLPESRIISFIRGLSLKPRG